MHQLIQNAAQERTARTCGVGEAEVLQELNAEEVAGLASLVAALRARACDFMKYQGQGAKARRRVCV